MDSSLTSLIAFAVMLGTGLQAWIAIVDLRDNQRGLVATAGAIDELRNEYGWLHPLERRRRRRDMRKYLKDHPEDRSAWWRLRFVLMSWSLLFVSAVFTTFGALSR